jgi:hypothetical protein
MLFFQEAFHSKELMKLLPKSLSERVNYLSMKETGPVSLPVLKNLSSLYFMLMLPHVSLQKKL